MTDLRLRLSSPGRLIARVLPYFPGVLVEGSAIDIAQVGMTYTISWDAAEAGFSPFGLTLGAAADAAAARALIGISPPPVIVTAAGIVTVTATDTAVIINKAAPSVTPVQLPTVASRGRLPLLLADFAGNGGNITITPATGEKIMGLAADAAWTLLSGGAGLGGIVWLVPIDAVGWVIK